MTESYKAFLETIAAEGSKKVARKYSSIGDYEYTSGSANEIRRIIIGLKPRDLNQIINIQSWFRKYARYMHDNNLLQTIDALDKNEIWEEAKLNVDPKYISNSQFNKLYHDIDNSSELNSFYIQTLFKCIYEGIYCGDLSVIKNLRSSDISGNIVTLREDSGETYDLEISPTLAAELSKMSTIRTWKRNHRSGKSSVSIVGLFEDSCFKVDIRSNDSKYSYRFSYIGYIRNTAKAYLGRRIEPNQIYVSGIMYRIGRQLHELGITLEEAFAFGNKDRTICSVIGNELKRCNYKISVGSFKQSVRGHSELFETVNTDCEHAIRAASTFDEAMNTPTKSTSKPNEERLIGEELQDILVYRNISSAMDSLQDAVYSGKPKEKKEMAFLNGYNVYPRDRSVAANALKLAGNRCECGNHTTFIRKNSDYPYTEPHHLIPLAYSDRFGVSLDVEENIVSLCSNCHNYIHYGKNAEELVKKLYMQRKDMLLQVGLDISLEELLEIYM